MWWLVAVIGNLMSDDEEDPLSASNQLQQQLKEVKDMMTVMRVERELSETRQKLHASEKALQQQDMHRGAMPSPPVTTRDNSEDGAVRKRV